MNNDEKQLLGFEELNIGAPDSATQYGTPRHSGRYPWGSGQDPYQGMITFQNHVHDLKKINGWTDAQVAKTMGMTSSELRAKMSIYKDETRKVQVSKVMELKNKGYSNVAIGHRLGIPESSVRSYLKTSIAEKNNVTNNVADVLKNAVDKNKYVDVGSGTECYLGVTDTKKKTAIALLKEQGYKVQYVQVEQLGTGKKTSVKVLTKDDTPWVDVLKAAKNAQIALPTSDEMYLSDGGKQKNLVKTPTSIDSNRVQIRYAEEGGKARDGLIELRRGVEDISLGSNNYAQVRIAVDGKYYLKGMAVYADDLPKGVDIRVNSKESLGTAKEKCMKKLKEPDSTNNPFGASIVQREYEGADGKKHLSAINIVNEQGDWEGWSKTLSSQVLAKQPVSVAKEQLKLAFNAKEQEFNDIMSLTNPEIKKSLLESFAEDCDSASVHLKAAALPRQAAKVLLPSTTIGENEIYAPGYENGETVVLIRFPHGGRFEMPTLTVNNNDKSGRAMIGTDAEDAVVIHPKAAERLSGADFDGDTALVIPNNEGRLKTDKALEGLKGFEPRESYHVDLKEVKDKHGKIIEVPVDPSIKLMTEAQKGKEMGKITNLIADMTIKGASADELCRAVKHSMVVIDAYKHHLDYKQSEIDQRIPELKKTYQKKPDGGYGGTSTLITRAKSETHILDRKEGMAIKDKETGKIKIQRFDPETGEKLYTETGETIKKYKKNPDGTITVLKEEPRTIKSTKMAETKDAFTLSSGTAIEKVYAEHANRLKALANKARKEYLAVGSSKMNPEAKKEYATEVATLNVKLNDALKNAPLERNAQLLANKLFNIELEAHPDMDGDTKKKIKGNCLKEARFQTGANKHRVEITPKEWEAITKGAVSSSTLQRIIANSDQDVIKKYATPKYSKGLSPNKLRYAKALLNKGYTYSEVASMCDIPQGTLSSAISAERHPEKHK